MDAEDLQIPQLSHFSHKNRSSYVEAAREIREFGKHSKLKDIDLRVSIAKALAKAAGVGIDKILTPTSSGGDKTLYPLFSKFFGIARPRGKSRAECEQKEQMLDEELQKPETNWQRICDASTGKLFHKDLIKGLREKGFLTIPEQSEISTRRG